MTRNQAIGRSRGGLTTKILALVDALGNLKRGLVFGNPHSVIGLLCACFDFALNDKTGIDGVFKAVRESRVLRPLP